MSKINMIHHINIQITGRQQTREWYERVLGAEFLDRGPAMNQRQLHLRKGTGEIHTSATPKVIEVPLRNRSAGGFLRSAKSQHTMRE